MVHRFTAAVYNVPPFPTLSSHLLSDHLLFTVVTSCQDLLATLSRLPHLDAGAVHYTNVIGKGRGGLSVLWNHVSAGRKRGEKG